MSFSYSTSARLSLGLLLIFSFSAMGFDGRIYNSLPSAETYPSPVGILFPAFQNAAGVNPAALPLAASRTTAMEFAYLPPLQSGASQQAFGSIASSNGTSGIGAGATAFLDPDHRAGGTNFIGGGLKIDRMALGIALRDTDLTQPYKPDVDIGMLLRAKAGPSLGMVLYHVNSSAQLDFGLGYSEERSYNLEINFLLPSFDHFSGSTIDYSLVFSATVYTGRLGLNFRTVASSQTSTATLGALINVSETFSLTFQWTNPSALTIAATIVF